MMALKARASSFSEMMERISSWRQVVRLVLVNAHTHPVQLLDQLLEALPEVKAAYGLVDAVDPGVHPNGVGLGPGLGVKTAFHYVRRRGPARGESLRIAKMMGGMVAEEDYVHLPPAISLGRPPRRPWEWHSDLATSEAPVERLRELLGETVNASVEIMSAAISPDAGVE